MSAYVSEYGLVGSQMCIRARAWISNRTDFMDRQFVAPPRLVSASGRVSSGFGAELIAPPGLTLSVYYTLDGTDPRLPGGRTNPAALRYTGSPIVLEANAKLVARSVNPFHAALTGPNYLGLLYPFDAADVPPTVSTGSHFYPVYLIHIVV